MLLTTIVFSACEQKKAKKITTKETAQPVSVAEIKVIVEVINPNLAKEDDILSATNASLTKLIIEQRPFLSAAKFISLLQANLSNEEMEAVLEKIFLPINLNTALEKEFLAVPGVGDKMAHEFDEYRPYATISQFRREIGKYVSKEQVSLYEQYVFVPVNLNNASKEEILAIPGVGNKMLHEFEEYRPYKSMDQFKREIGKYVSDDELARLERYVTL